jgi:hypothetical protein
MAVDGNDSHSVGWLLSGNSIPTGSYGFSYRVAGLDNGNMGTPFNSSVPLVVVFSTPGFNGGPAGSLLDSRFAIYNAVRADFDEDKILDADDIDLLYGLIHTQGTLGDLNEDHMVNLADMDYMITQVLRARYGDADLDGDVDGTDFDRWRQRPGYTGAGTGKWASGDFDGDLDVDGTDFDLWRQRPTAMSGAASQIAEVPEPSSIWPGVVGFGTLLSGLLRRWRKTKLDAFVWNPKLTSGLAATLAVADSSGVFSNGFALLD